MMVQSPSAVLSWMKRPMPVVSIPVRLGIFLFFYEASEIFFAPAVRRLDLIISPHGGTLAAY
jgi:hypothetical protein